MRFFIVISLLLSLLFSCNTTSINSAYKDYYKSQQNYISALLDNNKNLQKKYLKEIIECGEYLDFDVSSYKKSLKQLSNKPYKSNKFIVKIFSYNPLTIKINSKKNIKIFSFYANGYYKKVIDIKNAYILYPIYKHVTEDIKLRAAQYKKNIVRFVIYSHNKFKITYKIKNNILLINIPNKQIASLPFIENITKPKKQKFKKIIVIDPGHGGKDVGGIGINHVYEKDAVLAIAKYLRDYLKKDGFIVYMTRDRDKFIKLRKRTHFANQKNADLFISIHCNIAPKHLSYIHGIETYFLSPTRNKKSMNVAKIENKEIGELNSIEQKVILNFLNRDRIIESNKFGIDVQRNVLLYLRSKYKNVKDNGVRPAPFWVLVGTQMPAILIETGYLTNPMEAKRLFNPTYQKLLAKGIEEGIKDYFRKNR